MSENTGGNDLENRKNFIKDICRYVIKCMALMVMLLAVMVAVLPQNVQAAAQQMNFRDGYNNEKRTDLVINNLVNYYKIRLPWGWSFADGDLETEISDKSVVGIEGDVDESDIFYVYGNANVPYNNYKPVTITVTKRSATGDDKVAVLNVHRYAVSMTTEKMTVYEGASFKVDYNTITDGSQSSGTKFDTTDSTVATVSDDGVVTAKKAGDVGIIVRNEGGNASMDLTVKAFPAVDKKSVTTGIGKSVTLKVNNLPNGTSVTWKSSNTKVATVAGGVVKAKATGKAVITASYKIEGKSHQSKCTVTVAGAQLSETKVTLPLRMTKTVKVTNVSGKAKWTTSNKKVATVKDGKITAVGVGKCKITAKVNGKTLVCNVQVRPNQQSWKVVTRAGYYRSAYDDYMISKVRYNANGSLTVEGYFLNTHIYNIYSFDYMYISVKDGKGRVIASYKAPKFKFKSNSYTVKKLTLTIPKSKVKKYVDLSKESLDFTDDYVYNYRY